jgi:hypothetical protein
MTIIIDQFREFLHNRIGTSLNDTEKNNLTGADDFEVGELVACNNTFRWGLIVDIINKDDDVTYRVLTSNKPSGISNIKVEKLEYIELNSSDLQRSQVVIEQTTKPNQKFTDELETYEVNF